MQPFMKVSNIVIDTLVYFCVHNSGQIKVDGQVWSLPKHQVMWAVPGDGQSHGVVSMHQLWEMLRPVCILIFTQFPSHLHQHLMGLLHLSIGLGVVWQSSYLPNAHELTQLTDDVALKGGPSITQEPGCCSKD